VIAHGKQVALMAPTELLAEQHASNFRMITSAMPLNFTCSWNSACVPTTIAT
jgi:ATP-dependent DNA helicase RecG